MAASVHTGRCNYLRCALRKLKVRVRYLGRFGLEGEPGLGEEALDEGGPVLDALEPVLDDRGELAHVPDGEVAQAVFRVGPGALNRLSIVRASLAKRA